jgi:hypothetical protein
MNSLLSALVSAGDEPSAREFIEWLRGRLKAGSWYQSDFDAMHALNRFTFPELYGKRFEAGYPLRSGTVVEHAKALSEWTGIPFEVSAGVPKVQKLEFYFGAHRLQVLMRTACYGGICVLEKDRARVMTREEAAKHWIEYFSK